MNNEATPVNTPSRRPTHAVVTVPDPEHLPTATHVEHGGTLEFRCETPNYPHFDVCFKVTDQSGKVQTLIYPGSIDRPVVITVAEDSGNFQKEGEYQYTVHHYHHKPKKGEAYSGPSTGTWSMFVKHCRGC